MVLSSQFLSNPTEIILVNFVKIELENMLFKKIIGQEQVKNKLIQTVTEQRVSHALMFTGEVGFGGLPLAIAYAQYLLCESRNETDSCGECPSCQKVAKLIHPDLHFVFPVTTIKSNLKPISDNFLPEWREEVIEDPYLSSERWYKSIGIEDKQGMIYTHESEEIIKKLSLKTFEAEYKVMIIWQPERMNPTCSNKLLKILEEPPPKTLFLLVSAFPALIIPTLLSRVQMIRIQGIFDESLSEALHKKLNLPEIEISNAVKLAGGNYIKALEFIHSNEDRNYYFDLFKNWMRLCFKKDVPGILEWVEDVSKLGREKKKAFLNYALGLIRENFLWNKMPDHKDQFVKLPEEEDIFSKNFSPFISEENIFKLSKLINSAIFDIEANAYPKTVFLDTSIQVMGLIGK